MSFLETPRFNDSISYGSKGGPLFNTTVIEVNSGIEHRNVNWSYPKSSFDVSFGIRRREDLYDLVKFFRAVHGRGYGFRFKDWSDFKSHHGDQIDDAVTDTDQLIAAGDGVETAFQLLKQYPEGLLTGYRMITKPITGTVVISLDDVSQSTGWSVDTATGIVTFVSPPGSGVDIKAGFEFDVPVRFESDSIETNLEFYHGGSISVVLKEVRV